MLTLRIRYFEAMLYLLGCIDMVVKQELSFNVNLCTEHHIYVDIGIRQLRFCAVTCNFVGLGN